MPTLTETVGAIQAHIAATQDPETGEISQEALDRLEQLNMNLEQKADAYGVVHRQFKAAADACKAEAARFTLKARHHEAAAERLRQHLFDAMEHLKMKAIKTDLGSATIQKSPDTLRMLVSDNAVPDDWTYLPPAEVDRKRIKEALKDGQKLDFAQLETKKHLVFR